MHLLNGVLPVGYINKKAINRCTFVLLTQTGAQVLTCIAMVNCDRGDYKTRLTSKEQTKMSSSTTVHNLLFCGHTICVNFTTETFLLVVTQMEIDIYFVLCISSQGYKRERKHTTNSSAVLHNFLRF